MTQKRMIQKRKADRCILLLPAGKAGSYKFTETLAEKEKTAMWKGWEESFLIRDDNGDNKME